MKLAGIEIVGESVSGFGTAISLPELGIALDCGVITPATMACQHVLITHAHMDHLHCAVRHMYLRDMTGSPHKSIFYVPAWLEEDLHILFAHWAKMQCRRNSPPHEIVVVRPGDTVQLRKGLVVKAFKTIHRIPSQGYVISDVRQKLKPEFEGVEGREIGRLRKSGVEVTSRLEVPLVAFTGDTKASVFDRCPAEVLRAKVLITECTFMGEEQTPAFARKRGHVHMDELAERADLFKNEALLLAHFSQRYKNREIEAAMEATLPNSLLKKASYLPI
jgi:ribonuclease Z